MGKRRFEKMTPDDGPARDPNWPSGSEPARAGVALLHALAPLRAFARAPRDRAITPNAPLAKPFA
jgi:hypothetical protein